MAHDRRVIETSTLPTQDRTRRLLMPALAGIAAAALGLGVAELVAGLLGRTATPVLAVGEAFIDRVPTWLKDLAVDWFGTADKAVLIGGVLLVFGALSAGIGVLASRNRSAGLFGAAALGAIAALAVWSRPDSATGDLLPTIVGAGVSLIALDRLTARAPAVEVGTDDADGRRTFMRIVGLVAGLGLVAFFAGRWLGGRRSAVEESREAVALPDQRGGATAGRRPRRRRRRAVADAERGLLPDRHGAGGTARAGGDLGPARARHGRARGEPDLRRPGRHRLGRALGHAHVRVERGGWRPGRQRAVGRGARGRRACDGRARRGRRRREVHVGRRVDGRNAVGRADGRPRCPVRGSDER